ncbi:Bloom syndrome homolog [Paramuricea clavata]|uniref:ATP-dependent DNA helicase n=1 Tax=Paramuricea clavata TaxID=317549 RepID=A0A6S7LSK0_PARCT|nr:Bloom syndrome homolog [Paramuricea clavata]
MKKLSSFSSGKYQQIFVKDENFLKTYNSWKSGDDVEIECVRNIATEHYIESMVDTNMVTENLQSSTCSSTNDQQECYINKPKNAGWTDLLKCGTLSPSRGSDLKPVMEMMFGHASFQPKQEQALDLILAGKTVFVSLPTSGGKSLLYMLPSIISRSLTVVVVPLKSLMEDQFARCQELGLPAAILHGDVSYCDREKVYAELKQPNSEIRLLYITAEFLSNTPSLMELLVQLHATNSLRQFVVDEAHCVSQWGHDFRPAYKFLKSLHTKFPKVPFLLLSASATICVREDVCKMIGLSSVAILQSSCVRSNLQYQVHEKGKKTIDEIAKDLSTADCGLVYCNTRAETEVVAAKLQTANIKCKAYHGGLSAGLKKKLQSLWIDGSLSTLVCTTAFGMGIDKANVRVIIHYSLPASIEEYYQESGRGGRNGCACKCVIYFSRNDKPFHLRGIYDYCLMQNIPIHLNSRMLTFQKVVKYCMQLGGCRWQTIANHFGEEMLPCSACDLCQKKQTHNVADMTNNAITAIKCLQKLKSSGKSNFTLKYLANVLTGKKQKDLISNQHHLIPEYGQIKLTVGRCESLLQNLVVEDILREVPPRKGSKNRNALYIDFGCFYMNVLSNDMVVMC